MASFTAKDTDGEVLDVNGAWVMPGLIESHAHIGITEEKWGTIGDDSNEQTLPICAGLAVKHGLPMEGGLKAITINAAKICGVADVVGSLKAGKHADIAVFSGNPLELFTQTLYTVIDGKVIYMHKEQK